MVRNVLSSLVLLMSLTSVAGSLPANAQQAPRIFTSGLPPAQFAFRVYGPEQGLGNLAVWAVTQDLQGFIWVATEFGIYRYDGHRFESYTVNQGIPLVYVDNLLVNRSGKLWAGTISGLASLENNRFLAAHDDNGPISGTIVGLINGPDDRTWVGLSQGPLRQEADLIFRPVPGWTGGVVTSLWCGPNSDTVWAAGRHQGLTGIYRWRNGAFHELNGDDQLRISQIDAFAQDGQGRIWARSQQDLWFLSPQADRFERLLPALPPTSQRASLATDDQQRLLVSTSEGIWWQQSDGWLTIRPAEGLPNSTIKGMFMDREGSLWLASIGLFRLQGRGIWRAYTTSQGLPSELVWSIFRLQDGRLLVGTDQGPVLANQDRFMTIPGLEEGRQIRTIVQAADGTVYMAGTPEIIQWNPLTNQIIRLGPESGLLRSGRIFRLLFDNREQLWVGTQSGGLLCGKRNASGWQFKRVVLPDESPEETIRDLKLDSEGRVWASGSSGLTVLDGEVWHRFNKDDGLRETHLSYVCQRRDGTMVAVYFNAMGFSQFRYHQGRLDFLSHSDEYQGYSPGIIYLIGDDTAGNLWVGTGMGVDVIQTDGHIDHFSREDGLVGEDTSAQAFLAEAQSIWIGTSSGLALFDPSQHKLLATPPAPVILRTRFGDQPESMTSTRELNIPYKRRTLEIDFSTLSFIREGAISHQTRLIGLDAKWRETEGRRQLFPGLPTDSYTFEVRSRIGQNEWGPASSFSFTILPAWWQSWWFRGLLLLLILSAISLLIRQRTRTLRSRNQLLEDLVKNRTTELQKAMESLRTLSLTDPLTGMRNRRFLTISIPKDVALTLRTYNQLTRGERSRMTQNVDLIFLMVDLDHFKEVNDRYGHAAGDIVLQQTKDILAACVREADILIRWGGEEFLVVGRHASRSDAWSLAERIRTALAQHLFHLGDGLEIRLTCSIGVASFPFLPSEPAALNWEHVVDIADSCLYAAKRSGRNVWVGVQAGQKTQQNSMGTDYTNHLPQLIADGLITLHTSLSNPAEVRWVAKEWD